MDNWIIINYIFGIVDSLLMFYFLDELLIRKQIKNRKTILIIFLQASINCYINYGLGIAQLLGLLIMVGSTAILFNIIFKEKFVSIAFLIILGVVLISVVEIVVTFIIIFIKNADSSIFFTNNIYRIIGAITSKLIVYLIIKHLVGKIRFKITNYIHKSQIYQLIIVLVLNIIIIFIVIWFYKNIHVIRGNETKYIVILSAGVIIFTIAILSITKKIIEYAGKEVEWNLKEREYKRQNFYLNNIDDMLKNLRAQRHDFNHHIGCIYGLINMEKFEEARDYIEKLTKEAKEYNEIINVNNPVLMSLLNVKMTKAKKKKIQIETNINIDKDLSIEYIDLSIIIGNVLDNAIEACEEEEGNRYIELEIYTKMSNLIIKARNTKHAGINLQDKISNEGFTTKQDIINHGFGLGNIKKTVEKYRGIIKVEEERNIFKINIALPIKNGRN